MSVYRGVARGGMVELMDGVMLPDGLEVEVSATQPRHQMGPPGSPATLLKIFDSPSACAPEAVDELQAAISEGRRLASFRGLFDE